jgi:hypothetical protein
VLAAIVAIGAGAWWLVAAARRRRWDATYATNLAEARWASDVLAPSVTDRGVPSDQLAAQWPDSKRRLDDLQSALYAQQADIPDPVRAQRLGAVTGSVTALTVALARDVALRTGAAGIADAELAESEQRVADARDALSTALTATPTSGTHRA